MARCNDCNKFVSLDTDEEPEVDVEASEIEGIVSIEGTVRITNNCADCGTEMREATFDVDETLTAAPPHNKTEDCTGYNVSWDNLERYDRREGKGRGAKTFYGVEAEFVVECDNADCEWSASVMWHDDIQASSMEEY